MFNILLWSWIKSLLWFFFLPFYLYVVLLLLFYLLCFFFLLYLFFHHFFFYSHGVMDNIWYSSITLTAALKMSSRHHHISLRASILPHAAPASASSTLCLLSHLFLAFPHPFNCWELRPSNALLLFFFFPFPSRKKSAAHMIRLVFKQRLQNDVTYFFDSMSSLLLMWMPQLCVSC